MNEWIEARQSAPASRKITFEQVMLGCVFVNSFFTAIYVATGVDELKLVALAVSIAMLFLCAMQILLSRRMPAFDLLMILLPMAGVAGAVVVNHEHCDMVDVSKYISTFLFYFAAKSARCRVRKYVAPFVILFAIFIISIPFCSVSRVDNEVPVGYFPNGNTASIYVASLLFALSCRYKHKVVWLQFVSILLFHKIGVALSTIFAVILWNFRMLKRYIFRFTAVAGIFLFIGYAIGAFSRIIDQARSFRLLANLGYSGMLAASYGMLLAFTGTQDLSGVFRLRHWSDIMSIYSRQSFIHILFGYGPGQTKHLTIMQLVPHNDYLHVLAEYGLINLILFVVFLFVVVKRLPDASSRSLFTVMALNFFTENLLTGFTTMALFFGYAGLFTFEKEQSDALQALAADAPAAATDNAPPGSGAVRSPQGGA